MDGIGRRHREDGREGQPTCRSFGGTGKDGGLVEDGSAGGVGSEQSGELCRKRRGRGHGMGRRSIR